MTRATCKHLPCNYPEGECIGHCCWTRQQHEQAAQEQADQDRRTRDSLTAAAICLAAMAAIAVAGVLAALLAHLARWVGIA